MIYAIFMAFCLILYPLMNGGTSKTKKKQYCIVIGILLFLIASFRSITVGFDVGQYVRHFNACSNMGWEYLFVYYHKEPGFYVLCKLISIFTNNYQWMFAIVGAFYAFSVSRFIFLNSKKPMISFVMMIPFQFFAFSLSGLRQTIALSIVLFAFEYVKKRRFIPFAILIFVGFFFHNTIIAVLPMYFLYNIKPNTTIRCLFTLLMPAIYLFRKALILLGSALFSKYEYLSASESPTGTMTTLILYLAIWLLYILLGTNNIEYRRKGIESLMLVGIAIQIIVPFQPTLFRLAMYYQYMNLLTVPELFDSTLVNRNIKIFAYLVFILLMFLMYFIFTYNAAGVNPYTFFWDK